MYYQIFVNGITLGTFGHPNVENMNLSLQTVAESTLIFASAVCKESGSLYLIEWLQHPISAHDVVEFKLACEGPVPEPIKKYKMKSATSES